MGLRVEGLNYGFGVLGFRGWGGCGVWGVYFFLGGFGGVWEFWVWEVWVWEVWELRVGGSSSCMVIMHGHHLAWSSCMVIILYMYPGRRSVIEPPSKNSEIRQLSTLWLERARMRAVPIVSRSFETLSI